MDIHMQGSAPVRSLYCHVIFTRLHWSLRLNNHIYSKEKSKHSKDFIDEKDYKTPGSQTNSQNPFQNGAQLCEELETASSVTSSQKILPKLLQTGK